MEHSNGTFGRRNRHARKNNLVDGGYSLPKGIGCFPGRLNSVKLTECSLYLTFDAVFQPLNFIKLYSCRMSLLGHLVSSAAIKSESMYDNNNSTRGQRGHIVELRWEFFHKKMSREKKTMGVGAVVSALSRMIHPSASIREKYPNPQHRHRLENLLVIRQEAKKINHREQMAIVMRHDDFPGVELYCVEKFVRIETSGSVEHYFTTVAAARVQEDENGVDSEALPQHVVAFLERDLIDNDSARLIANAIPTDNDNDPAPENVPQGDHFANLSGEWGHNNICSRRITGVRDNRASVRIPREFPVTMFRLFELFFFKTFVMDTLLPLINSNIAPGEVVSYGEFLRWIGIWLLMSCKQGATRREGWSSEPPSLYKGSESRYGSLMSRNRFEAILYAIRYTNVVPPTFRDPFHEVRQMVNAWNGNMENVFEPSWISCLDESMSYWTNIYSCPGFMFVPRKPWPFGNEWHTICCANSGVMYAIELVEGKDRPREMGPSEFENLGGKTVGLLLRLTKQIWNLGKVVVLDSGFCVARALTQLSKKGVFATALIKKRRYWPKHVNGDMIKAHFANANVGDTDCYRISLPDDNAILDIHCLKEPDYVMMLMATFGTQERVGQENFRNLPNHQRVTTFRYPELFYNHYHYRHAVDDHNNRRHAPVSIEKTWTTNWWPHRVFAFILLAITEVNVMKAWVNILGNPDNQTLHFRKILAEQLVNNPYLAEESAEDARQLRRSARGIGHNLITLPPFSRFKGTKIVTSKTKYPQRSCSVCKRKCRASCSCTPGIMLCNRCFPTHLVEMEIQNEATE